jgi:hypothetical protein
MSKTAKLRRVSELFERGEIVAIDDPRGEPLTFWVMKPNDFEKDEALKDGRFGRAIRAQAFDRDPVETAAVHAVVDGLEDADLVQQALQAKNLEHFTQAQDEVRTDKAWTERLAVIDRAEIAADRPATPAEVTALAQISEEHQAAVLAIQARLSLEYNDELTSMTRDDLEKGYIASWRDNASINAFYEQRRQTEIFFALRDCVATKVDGAWVHTDCHHEDRILEGRAQVLTSLPDELLAKVVAILAGQMSLAEAGNLDAPSVSSEPLEPQSKPEDSQPSTPTETSAKPAGTSSTRSAKH